MRLLWDILTDLFAFAWVACLLLSIFLGPFVMLGMLLTHIWGAP